MFEYRHNKCVGRHSPASHIRRLATARKIMETKKDVGVKILSVLIPTIRPSHCLQDKDKQRKSLPTPSDIYTPRPDNPRHTYTQKYPLMGVHLNNI